MKKAARYSSSFKDKVLADLSSSVSTICKKYQIDRSTYYAWKKEAVVGKSTRLKKYTNNVLEIVKQHPNWSVDKIHAHLSSGRTKQVRSRAWIQKVLQSTNLSTISNREKFAITSPQVIKQVKRFTGSRVSEDQKASADFRKKFIELVAQGFTVKSVCQGLKINRSTYYKWLRLSKMQNSLSNNKPGVKQSIDSRIIKIVFDIVKIYPQWSIDQIYTYINESSTVQLISRGSIQKLLQKNKLSTFANRQAYSFAHTPQIATESVIVPQQIILPQVEKALIHSRGDPSPPFRTNTTKSIFKVQDLLTANFWQQSTNVGYVIATVVISILNSYLFSLIINAISNAEGIGQKIGMAMSSLALFCGLFFFLYSTKYYITIAAVILKSTAKQGQKVFSFKLAELALKIPYFGTNLNKTITNISNNELDPVSLHKKVQETELSEYPFFSVQIPLYNEKKVANRVTAAAAAMDYPNFEVLVCDDSTDETTQLLYDKWNGHDKVKILHRTIRSGFKGAALDNALKLMDPRTEYVVVFDADFVPYPDTLQLFAKYFKVIAENEFNNASNYDYSNANQVVKDIQAAQFQGKTVAVQGYQWHVLNKSENWITRAVRSEFAGSYIIERSGGQVFGLLKQIAGSVYAINAKVLKEVGWGTSITEDFQLTLKLYEQGYKVAYTPYIQAPSECVSTLKRLIRQRQRWAEGHSFNIKHRILEMLRTPNMTVKEKWEAIYLTPYYLQSFIFIFGSLCWIIAETIFKVRLPFWTTTLGWSLVLTNLFSLPLMNVIGLFLEEGEERDYLGIFSFITLCYILAPFIGFAALKGFLEKEEGPWFRTPKSGHITDKITRERKREKIVKYLPWIQPAIDIIGGIAKRTSAETSPYLAYATAGNDFNNGRPQRSSRLRKRATHLSILILLSITVLANIAQTTVPQVFANPDTYYLKTTGADNLTDTANDRRLQGSTTIGSSTNTQTLSSTNPTMYMITDNLNKRWTNDTKVNDSTTTGDRRNVSIATDSTGNTTAVWEDSRNTDSSQNKFTNTTGGLIRGRYSYSATNLIDGRAIIAGGYSDSTGSFESSAEIYDPVTSTFSLLSTSMTTMRLAPKAVTLNDGRVLIAGGRSATNTVVSSSDIFDPNTNTFVAGPNMSTARTNFQLIKLNNGKVLAITGCTTYASGSCSLSTSSTELFDPATNTWTLTGSVGVSGQSGRATLLPNGEVLEIENGSSTYRYNPVTGIWRKTGTLNEARSLVTLAPLNDGKILAVGGFSSNYTSTAEVYDPTSEVWSTIAPLGAATYGFGSTGLFQTLGNGKVLLTGFDNGGGAATSSVAEIYDPITQTHTVITNPMTSGRGYIEQVILPNGKVLLAGGWNGSASSTTADLYSPVTYDIYTQKYDKTGAKLWNSGTDLRVNSDDGNRVSSSGPPNYNHLNPSVALDGSGNAIIAWEEQREGVANNSVWSQKLQSSNGNKLWPNGTQNAFSAVNSAFPGIRGGLSFSATSTLLNNGKLFIAGSESSGAPRTTTDIYDPITNTMTAGPSGVGTRTGTISVPLLNGKVLVVGAANSAANTQAELYDPVSNTFTLTTGGLTAQRQYPGATVLKNGKVFIAGTNVDPSAAQSSTEIYDPVTNTFVAGPIMNFPRRMQQQTLLPNGKVLIVGGIASGAGPTTPEIYDPMTNTISISAARHPSMSRGSTISLNNGKVLIIGTNGTSRSFADLYDPTTDSITQTGNMSKSIDRTLFSPVVLPNGKVLLPGGADSTPTGYSSSEIYDPATNTWTSGPNMKAQRQQAVSTWIPESNKIFVMGGADSAENTTAELYTPVADMPVSNVDYRSNFVWPQANLGNINGLIPKKPKVTIDSSGDAIIAWQEGKGVRSQLQDLSHAYDANARLSYGRNPAVNGQCSSAPACGALPAITSPAVQIVAQKICNQSSCTDAGTTSGEKQWGNDQVNYNRAYAEDRYVATIKNSQNVSVIADGTSSAFIYDSDSGSTTDINTNGRPNTKTRKVYMQKFDANGNSLLSSGWSAPTGGMVTNRRTQTTTLLNNGAVLLAGGQNTGVLSSGEVYSPDTGTSTVATNNMTVRKINHAATLLANGKVLITGGGTSSTTSSTTANLFTPSGNSGSFAATAGNMKVSRSDHSSTLLRNGKVLIAGGRNATTATSSSELYDSTTATAANVFTATTGSLTAGIRYGHRATLLANGNVLIAGGTNGTGPLSSAEIYDDASNTWSKISIMAQKRSMFAMTLLNNGKVLAVGGCIAGNCTSGTANRTSTAELYDPLTNTWTNTGSLISGVRSELSANLLPSGNVLIHGGTTDGTTFLSTSEIYDPITGTFTAGSVAQKGRKDHDSIVLANGKLLTVDGWDGTTAYSNTELYSVDQQLSTANSTDSKNPDLIKDSTGNIQAVWQAWRSEGLSPGTSGGSWKIMSQEINNPSSGSVTKQYPSGSNGTWTSSGNLTTGAYVARGITTLPNGKVLVAGGTNPTAETSSAEIYDPQAGTWTSTGSMNQSRGSFGIYTLSNGKVIAYGGYSAGGSSSIYDPTGATWSTGPNLINSRTEFASSMLDDGTILAVGGTSGAGSTSEIYNPTTNTWTLTTGNLAVARNAVRTVKLNNGSVLAIGGCTNATTQSCSTSASSSVEIYNPATQTWSTLPGLVTGRRNASLNLLNDGRVLVVGGKTVSNGEISSAEIYDTINTKSTSISNAPAGVSSDYTNYGQGVVLPSGKVLFAGISASTYLYDPVLNTWSTTGAISKSYYSANPLLLKNGKVFIASGYDGGTTYYSSSELYTPDLSERIVSTDDLSRNYNQTEPRISADTASGYSYVAWNDDRLTSPSDTTSGYNIYMQKLDGSGNPSWPNGLNENGSYNVRDVRVDNTRSSLNTTTQTKVAIAKSVFTNTATDVPVQLAWMDSRDGTPLTSIYGQSYNTRNYSMSSTNWTAYYYVTGSPTNANSISVQVGAAEADGETMSYTSASSTYTGDTSNGQKSTVFSSLPPTGDTSLTNRRLVMRLTRVTGTMQIQYNGSAGVADTRLDVGTIVPERSLVLALLIPLLPMMVFANKRKQDRTKRNEIVAGNGKK